MPRLVEINESDCSATLDARALPLLIASWIGNATVPLVDRYFDAQITFMQELDALDQRCLLLTMADRAGRPSAMARQRIVDRTKAARDMIDRVVVGSAIVMANPLVRGAMTAIGWIDPSLRVPYLADYPAGLRWVDAEVAKHRLPAPDLSKLDDARLG